MAAPYRCDILNVLKSASDVSYGKQAVDLNKKIAADKAAGTDPKQDQDKLQAVLQNIQDPDLAKLFQSSQ